MMDTYKLMQFDPGTGVVLGEEWIAHHYRHEFADRIWIYNPYNGSKRDLRDIESDPFGVLIVGAEEPSLAYKGDS